MNKCGILPKRVYQNRCKKTRKNSLRTPGTTSFAIVKLTTTAVAKMAGTHCVKIFPWDSKWVKLHSSPFAYRISSLKDKMKITFIDAIKICGKSTEIALKCNVSVLLRFIRQYARAGNSPSKTAQNMCLYHPNIRFMSVVIVDIDYLIWLDAMTSYQIIKAVYGITRIIKTYKDGEDRSCK